MTSLLPLVGVTADIRCIEGGPIHAARAQYLTALMACADLAPVIIPSSGDPQQLESVMACLDGLLLTGAVSNIHPSLYGGLETPAHAPFDPKRDQTSLPLIALALERGLPLLGICRGFQELNVCLGGSLHPALHDLPDHSDHRRCDSPDVDIQYSVQHDVYFTPGGFFATLADADSLKVNSLHFQGIDRLAAGLSIEAVAPDGVIEAVRVKEAKSFAVATQWHPEYHAENHVFSQKLFAAFGQAVRAFQQDRRKV